MKILGYIIKPEKEYRSVINGYEDTVAALKLERERLKQEKDAERQRLTEEIGRNIPELTRLRNIVEHMKYTLKNKPKLDRFNWDKEYAPYVERLEKIVRGEMIK